MQGRHRGTQRPRVTLRITKWLKFACNGKSKQLVGMNDGKTSQIALENLNLPFPSLSMCACARVHVCALSHTGPMCVCGDVHVEAKRQQPSGP